MEKCFLSAHFTKSELLNLLVGLLKKLKIYAGVDVFFFAFYDINYFWVSAWLYTFNVTKAIIFLTLKCFEYYNICTLQKWILPPISGEQLRKIVKIDEIVYAV